jgi:hypothetical protein
VAEQFGARTGLALGGFATLIASAALLWGLSHWHVGQPDPSGQPQITDRVTATSL